MDINKFEQIFLKNLNDSILKQADLTKTECKESKGLETIMKGSRIIAADVCDYYSKNVLLPALISIIEETNKKEG